MEQHQQSAALNPAARRAVWVSMAEIYGRHWTDTFGDSESGAASTWARGLADLTPEQLSAGVQASVLAVDTLPPTLGEFRARCLGILTLPEVRHELRAGAPRSIFTYMVWQCLDRDAYARARGRHAARLLQDAYSVARALCMRGKPVGQVSESAGCPAIAHDQQQTWAPPPPAQRAAVLARARTEAGLVSIAHHPTHPTEQSS
ncbi:hypothetical protein [Luteimonas mephitis]|uniref:hypothetical protein n=1 Tax=Luteimonas mephitis TaxID=83615 RepID=UPI0012ECB887|nr:hypothetical protein [Luteimonas mephitis]